MAVDDPLERLRVVVMTPVRTANRATTGSFGAVITRELRRLHDAFPRDRVLVLAYEDFRRDNLAVLGQVLEFLHADPAVPIEPVETKRLREVRSLRLHQLRRATRAAQAIVPRHSGGS